MLARLKVALLVALVCWVRHETRAFWLTDMSLFPVATLNNLAQTASTTSNQANDSEASTSNSIEQVQAQPQLQVQLQAAEASKSLEVSRTKQQPGQPSSTSSQKSNHNVECTCNTQLIHQEVGAWLSRWLLAGSPATPTSGPLSGAEVGRKLAMAAMAVGGQSGGSSGQQPQASHNRTGRPLGVTTSRHLRLLAGPQGPKGDVGPRGERGPEGPPGSLLSVATRQSLYELTGSRNNNIKDSKLSKALVFVESEQMLLIGTASGWRQVLLGPPLLEVNRPYNSVKLSAPGRGLMELRHNSQSGALKSQGAAKSQLLKANSLAYNVYDGLNVNSNSNDNNNDNSRRRNDIEDGADDDDIDDKQDDDDDDEDEDDEGDDEDDDAGERDDDDDLAGDDDDDNQMNDAVANNHNSKRNPSLVRQVNAIDSINNDIDQVQSTSGVSLKARANDMASESTNNNLQQQQTQPSTSVSVSASAPAVSHSKLRLIALNEPFSGNLRGIRGADFECKRQAARSNVRGSFRAFLASNSQNLHDLVRLQTHRSSIMNLRDEILASSWQDLLRQPTRFVNPLSRIYSFDGRHVASDSNWPNKLVWHGASQKSGLRDPNYNCDSWHSDSMGKFGRASPLHLPREQSKSSAGRHKRRLASPDSASRVTSSRQNYTNNHDYLLEAIDKYPCRMPLIVLCIETIAQH